MLVGPTTVRMTRDDESGVVRMRPGRTVGSTRTVLPMPVVVGMLMIATVLVVMGVVSIVLVLVMGVVSIVLVLVLVVVMVSVVAVIVRMRMRVLVLMGVRVIVK